MADEPYDYDKDPNPYKSPPLPEDDKKWAEQEKKPEGRWLSGEELKFALSLLNLWGEEIHHYFGCDINFLGANRVIFEHYGKEGSFLKDNISAIAGKKIPGDSRPSWQSINLDAAILKPPGMTPEEKQQVQASCRLLKTEFNNMEAAFTEAYPYYAHTLEWKSGYKIAPGIEYVQQLLDGLISIAQEDIFPQKKVQNITYHLWWPEMIVYLRASLLDARLKDVPQELKTKMQEPYERAQKIIEENSVVLKKAGLNLFYQQAERGLERSHERG